MSARKVGIRQVAAAAGVSVTTVSHALNGKGRLPDATRERVRDVAERLGYRPSAAARNLVGGKTGLLGLTVSQPAGRPLVVGDFAYFVDLMSAASAAAIQRGYALVLTPGEHGRHWPDIDLDGAIVVDPVADDPLVSELRQRNVPVVTTGRVPGAAEQGPWVDNDHVAGAESVLEHLRRRGARRIALVTTEPDTSYAIDWQTTYLRWCDRRGLEPLVQTRRDGFGEAAGFAAAAELLVDPDPPDAIWATLDRLALGVLLAARAHGIGVPGELMVVGSTDSHSARSSRPALTTLDLHPGRIGDAAVRLLVEVVEDRAVDPGSITVPTRMHPRASTRRVRDRPGGGR